MSICLAETVHPRQPFWTSPGPGRGLLFEYLEHLGPAALHSEYGHCSSHTLQKRPGEAPPSWRDGSLSPSHAPNTSIRELINMRDL